MLKTLTPEMRTVHTVEALRRIVRGWKQDGLTVGLVPTMGALHDGHLSLVRAALRTMDRVIVSIFVNPTQFDNPADLGSYPRTGDEDARMLAEAGTHLLYAPTVDEMYPPGFATRISAGGVAEGLCGAHRPGHFDGVATVVCKLFLQSQADAAFFGEKDFQQVHVVRRMATDLDIPIRVVACPTRREADGLAMSSRNRRLAGAGERDRAGVLPAALTDAARDIAAGRPVGAVLAATRARLLQAGFADIEYLELRRDADLAPLSEQGGQPARLLAAGRVGTVRLIDNVPVGSPGDRPAQG
ncbi:pantoate--beta-alanine ligase [Gluconacetobacter azotocaptans]|uniref:Pantothenate synthetase n=2 Tax=Gluconacetobacter azotocaptans TaxID=142834 RepID=A0A7W4JSV6_9PROT|nr:pantoate--beta-alanine ligase [Gluconacetobacter azotocaptans]MBB2190254.1 pantoate--beta-alanine ligase [Gluconacetobacter azotocaptans]